MKSRIVFLAFAAAFASQSSADAILPSYADSAFPVETRDEESCRIAGELDAVIAHAKETDGMVDAAFAAIPAGDLVRIRLAKRREAREGRLRLRATLRMGSRDLTAG